MCGLWTRDSCLATVPRWIYDALQHEKLGRVGGLSAGLDAHPFVFASPALMIGLNESSFPEPVSGSR